MFVTVHISMYVFHYLCVFVCVCLFVWRCVCARWQCEEELFWRVQKQRQKPESQLWPSAQRPLRQSHPRADGRGSTHARHMHACMQIHTHTHSHTHTHTHRVYIRMSRSVFPVNCNTRPSHLDRYHVVMFTLASLSSLCLYLNKWNFDKIMNWPMFQ